MILQPGQIRTNKLLLLIIILLDLVGFSLIFPLVPDLLEHYLVNSANHRIDQWLLPLFSSIVEFIAQKIDNPEEQRIIIFGGILSSVYSILQFLVAPFWGRLSDRVGRRKILIISSGGLAVSYLIWFFSSSFTSFFISRILGGMMAGNLGVASAAMADMTSTKERTRDLGMVGAAIGIGFIIGPALGGLAARVNFTEIFHDVKMFHPYSFCSLISVCLSGGSAIFNFILFRETLHRKGKSHVWINNPIKTIQTDLNIKGIHYLFLMNFFYMLTFTGFEFTITFFYKLSFGLSPTEIGFIFFYLGILLAIGQGGLVRVLTPKMGERTMALIGLFLMPLPVYLMAFCAPHVYLSLICLLPISIGASLIQPALSGLTSLMTPTDRQGLALSVLRSTGSLARAMGPLAGAYLYWNYGIKTTYQVQAIALGLVFFLAFKLQERRRV